MLRFIKLVVYTINYFYRLIIVTLNNNDDSQINYLDAQSVLATRYRFKQKDNKFWSDIYVTEYSILQFVMVEAKIDSKNDMIVTTEISALPDVPQGIWK